MKKIFSTLLFMFLLLTVAEGSALTVSNVTVEGDSIKISGDAQTLYSVYVYKAVDRGDMLSSFAGTYDRGDLPDVGITVDLSNVLADATVIMTDENGIAEYSAKKLLTGIYNVEIISENDSVPYHIYFGKDVEKLFEYNAISNFTNPKIKLVLSLLTDRKTSEIEKAYHTFVNLSDRDSAIKIMGKKIDHYFVAAYLQQAIENNNKDQKLLAGIKDELRTLNIASEAINLFSKNVNYKSVTNDVKRSTYTNVEELLENLKTAAILRGIENVVNDKDAKAFLEVLGNPVYDKASADDKNYIANNVYGKYYSNLETLNDAIDKMTFPSGTGSGSGSGGGRTASNKATVSVGFPDNVSKESFTDVTKAHWCYEYVEKMVESGIINGYGDKFAPDNKISRAEYIKILCVSFGVITGGDSIFKDVTDNDWFAPYINAAHRVGLANGYDGRFCPNDPITRQDAATLAVRFAENNGFIFDGTNIEFADHSNIAAYANESVAKLVNSNVVNGYTDNTFKPQNSMTRGEAAKIVCQLIERGGQLK